jgi:glucokinase
VLPSEAGMADSVSPRSELEWRLLKFLRAANALPGDAFVELERVVSGPGLAATFDFVQSDYESSRALPPLRPAEAAELAAATAEDRPAAIARLAQAGALRALFAVDIFLSFYGRALGAAAITFLPFRGLFVAGGILPRLAWRLPCLGADARARDDPLIQNFLGQGPKMGETAARVPLLLLDDGDAGVKGALWLALASADN